VFTVAELKTNVEAAVPYTYYINEFPATGADNSAYVRMTGGFAPSQWTPQLRPSFQIVVRAKTTVQAEAVAAALWRAYHQRRAFNIGGQRIVATFADQPIPLYLGVDDNKRALYSVNFTARLLNN